jgi:hypothetical protein
VLASLSGTREQAKVTAAESELNSIRVGIQQLINATGKWPNGCPAGEVNNPSANLDAPSSGLVSQPSVGLVDGGPCEWTSEDVNQEWNGPYVKTDDLNDPWGNSYRFDPDYYQYRDCSTKPQGQTIPVVMSEGPTKTAPGYYDCDDVFIELD